MASRNQRDANIVPDSLGNGTIFSSLQTSGFHRTKSEIDDQGSLLETNLGAHVLYHKQNQLQLGFTILQTTFNTYFQKRNLAYNQYDFTGKKNLVVGLHGSYIWHNWNLFGEVAHSGGSVTNSGGTGAVVGALASLTKKVDVALLLRHYDRNFHSFYGNAFSEGTRNSNESGAYLGLKYTVYRKVTVGGFVDFYKFPWLKYLVDKPSGGFDYLLQAAIHPTAKRRFTQFITKSTKRRT